MFTLVIIAFAMSLCLIAGSVWILKRAYKVKVPFAELSPLQQQIVEVVNREWWCLGSELAVETGNVGKNLQPEFDTLVSLGWLEKSKQRAISGYYGLGRAGLWAMSSQRRCTCCGQRLP